MGNYKDSEGKTFSQSSQESQSTEWKWSWQDEYLKWLCGYANTKALRDTSGDIILDTNSENILTEMVGKENPLSETEEESIDRMMDILSRKLSEKEKVKMLPIVDYLKRHDTIEAQTIRKITEIVKENPHVIGDMTWTGYDYLGEAGCGVYYYDGRYGFTANWPISIAYIGDIDITGYRRPISYYREIVYGLRKKPYIAVERVNHYGESTTNYYVSFETQYQPGKLEAVCYRNGIEDGRDELVTAGADVELCAESDKQVLAADGADLACITICLKDKDGNVNLQAKKEVTVSVEGAGSLQGFGSADPETENYYDNTVWETYDGYLLAAVRAGEEAGEIKVSFAADGCETK